MLKMRKKIYSIILLLTIVVVSVLLPAQEAQAANYGHITDEEYAAATPWASISDYSRLANVLKKAENGEKITVVALGGSITQGVITPAEGEFVDYNAKPYATIVKDWFVNKFPNAQIKFVNAGVGATGSYYGVHRLNRDVLAYNPDLVLVEYAVNDNYESYFDAMAYENLVRRLLQYNSNTAVMLIFAQNTEGYGAQGYQSAFGANFRVPMISYANAMNYAMQNEGKSAAAFSGDKTHPSIYGHQVMGELICQNLDDIYAIKDSFCKPTPYNFDMLTYAAYDDARTIPWPEIGKVMEDGVMRFAVDASEIGVYWDLTDATSYTEFDVYVDDKFAKTISFDYYKLTHTGAFDQLYYGVDDYHVVEIRPRFNNLDYSIGINQVFVCQ